MAENSEEETEGEETIILTRRDRRRAGAASADSAVSAAAATDAVAAVAAAAAEPTGTEAVDAADEATVVVDRAAPANTDVPDEATVVVSRPERRSRRPESRADVLVEPGLVAGGSAAEPPAPASFSSVEPTPALYKPRPAPLEPAEPPVVVGIAAPSRVADPQQPSVAKQARRWSVFALSAFAAACAVSVAGLVGIGFLVFG